MISSTKNEEMSSGNDGKEMQRQSRRQQEANQIFAMHCEIFTKIEKISQSQRIFRYAHIFAKVSEISLS